MGLLSPSPLVYLTDGKFISSNVTVFLPVTIPCFYLFQELFVMYLTKLAQRHGDNDQRVDYKDLAAVVQRKVNNITWLSEFWIYISTFPITYQWGVSIY